MHAVYYFISIIVILIILLYFYQSQIINIYINNYVKYNIIYDKKPIQLTNILKNKDFNNINSNTIPNYLFQTYYDKKKIPQYIFDNVKLYANNYKYFLLDDKDAINFLNYYFTQDVVNRFNQLSYGAHKADLLRYCLLYIFGGIYLDIKTILIKPLDDIFKNKNYFYTCLSRYTDNKNFESYIYQGILASAPFNKLFLKLINFIVYVPLYYLNFPYKITYLIIIKHLYYEILKDIYDNNNTLSLGENKGKLNIYYLFEESCSKKTNNKCSILDRYGLCCSIYDNNEQIFIGRDPTFPW